MVSTPGKPDEEHLTEVRGEITPEDVRPQPNSVAQTKKDVRKKGKPKVLTETPEKYRIEEETIERFEKQTKTIANVGQTKLKS